MLKVTTLIVSSIAKLCRGRWPGLIAVAPIAAVFIAGGCARSPGNASNLGPSLLITVDYAGQPNIQIGYSYFVVIRDADDQQGKQGPIPVTASPYGGNGFATALQPETTFGAGFTDFAVYNVSLGGIYGCQLYHVGGGISGRTSSAGSFVAEGPPVNFVQPGATGNPNQIQFQIALSQILPKAGECDPNTPGSCPQAHFLQVNIIATSDLPANAQSNDPNFYTDAMGDQHLGSATFNSYLTVDTTSAATYSSTGQLQEPDDDTFPRQNDPAYEMTGWQIQVLR